MISLVSWLCKEYDIPAIRPAGDAYDYPDNKLNVPGIVAHGQVQPWNKTDPGPHFDWDGFMNSVQQNLDAGGSISPPTGLVLSSGSGGDLTFDWNPVSSANLYLITVALNESDLSSMAASAQIIYSGPQTSFFWQEGDQNVTYVWSVTAQNNYHSASTVVTPSGTYNTDSSPVDASCSAVLPSRITLIVTGSSLLGLLLLIGGVLLVRKGLN